MRKLSASIILALSLAGCSVPVAEPVEVTPKQTETTYEVKASEDARVTFPRVQAPVIVAEPVEVVQTAEPVAEPVEVAETIPEPVAPVIVAEPVAPVVETVPEPVPTVEAPVSVPEVVAVPVQPVAPAKPVETITETREPMPGHWGHAALASRGLYANIEVVDAVSVCRIATGSGGCAYIGSGTIMLSADLEPDWRGLHVLFHEYAHAVLGITDECEAERYAHSQTKNVVWSYPDCA